MLEMEGMVHQQDQMRAELEANAAEIFDVVLSGAVRIEPGHVYDLRDAARAHRDLEGRRTTGSIILVP